MAALRLGLSVQLRLLAPFLPYICEEVWSWVYADESGQKSIHRAPWPDAEELSGIAEPASDTSFDVAVACWNAINKSKADAEVSMGREAETLTLVGNAGTLDAIAPVLNDVLAATRCRSHTLAADGELEDGEFSIRDATFAPKPEKTAK